MKDSHRRSQNLFLNTCTFSWVFLCCLFLVSCDWSKPPVKIGMAVNLSGTGGASGEHIRNGALLAIKEINLSGGVKGRPIELIVRDDQGTKEGAVRADRDLIAAGVPVIVGHNLSSTTLAAYPVVTSKDILLLTACSATARLTGKKDLFFRTCVDCNVYGKKTALLLQEKKARSVAFLMDMANPGFVTDYALATEKHFNGHISKVKFKSGSVIDWDHITHQLLLDNPDAILLLTEATMAGVVLQKLAAYGYKGLRIATIWAQTPELIKYASKAGQGLSIVTYISPQIGTKEYARFQEEMKRAFHEEANARSAGSYELMMVLAQAMEMASDFTGPEIAKALLKEHYRGLMGEVAFDQYGDVIRPVFEVTIHNGKFVLKGKI